jgi:hypothetical protein
MKLEKLVSIINKGTSKEKLIEAFQLALLIILETEEGNKKSFSEVNSRYEEILNRINTDTSIKELREQLNQVIQEHRDNISKIKELKDGKDGQDGKTPIPGIDFPIPKDGINGKDGKSPIKGVDYFDGKNGLDADPELVKELVLREIEIPVFEKLENELPKLGDKVRDSLELLQGNDRLDKSSIKGLDDLERRIDGKHFPVMGGGTPVSVSYNGVLKDKEVRNINFIGDGVASVTQTNGTVDVSINGGDETDPVFEAWLDNTPNGTINRTGDYISSIVKSDGVTWTITRDVNNYITSMTDGSKTWTYTRDGNNQITSWAVA